MTILRINALVVALWILASTSVSPADLAVYRVFGLTLGLILQRSRICFASGFRDLFPLCDGGNLRAILTGLAVASLGFASIQAIAVPTLAFGAAARASPSAAAQLASRRR